MGAKIKIFLSKIHWEILKSYLFLLHSYFWLKRLAYFDSKSIVFSFLCSSTFPCMTFFIRFVHKNMKKRPSKVGYLTLIGIRGDTFIYHIWHIVLERIWVKGSYLSQWLPQGERWPPKESKSTNWKPPRWVPIYLMILENQKFLDHSEIIFCFTIHKKLNKSCSLEKKILFLKKKN